MASLNETVLNNFVGFVNTANKTELMKLFCVQSVTSPNILPYVGLTTRQGPVFYGTSRIFDLFTQLFKTFSNLKWTLTALRLEAANVIGVEMDVTGRQDEVWFQSGYPSPPFSQIQPGDIDNDVAKHRNLNIPAFAVFNFDGGGSPKIQSLSLYFDRYILMDQLAPSGYETINLPPLTHPPHLHPSRHDSSSTVPGKRITITID